MARVVKREFFNARHAASFSPAPGNHVVVGAEEQLAFLLALSGEERDLKYWRRTRILAMACLKMTEDRVQLVKCRAPVPGF